MQDEERRLWVLNDEPLYRWYMADKQGGLSRFIRENRKEITDYINRKLGKRG